MFCTIKEKLLEWRDAIAFMKSRRNNSAHKSKRQKLVDKIYDNFDLQQREYTTKLSLKFPTCYYVFMGVESFNFQYQSFKDTAQDVARMILCRIEELKKKYPKYDAHSNSFVFQFICVKDDERIDTDIIGEAGEFGKKAVEIDKEVATVTSSLYPPASHNGSGADDGQVVMTVREKDSVSFRKLDINLTLLKNIEVRGETFFRIPFSLNDDKGAAKPVATLRAVNGHFNLNGVTSHTYEMCTDLLIVSGRTGAPKDNDVEIARIDNDHVLDRHLVIRKGTEQGTFEVKAYGDTYLNEMPLPTFEENFARLPNNSDLLLNGEIQLHFSII